MVRRFVIALLLAGICLRPAMGRPQPVVGDGFERREETQRDRKTMRWYSLRRTRGDSPDEQLEHADRLREAGRLRRAGRAYNALVHRWHQEDEAVDAQLRLASLLYARGRYERAFKEFQYLIDHFAGQFPYEEAIVHQYRIIRHVMASRRLLGGRDSSRALPLLEQVIANAPAHEDAARARVKMGTIHEEGKDYADAVMAYEQVLQRHPRSPEVEEAAWRRALCMVQMSERTPRDEARARAALAALSAFRNRYPESAHAQEAAERHAGVLEHIAALHFEVADFYDRRARRPAAALIAYQDYLRKFPDGADRAAAEARIHALERETARP